MHPTARRPQLALSLAAAACVVLTVLPVPLHARLGDEHAAARPARPVGSTISTPADTKADAAPAARAPVGGRSAPGGKSGGNLKPAEIRPVNTARAADNAAAGPAVTADEALTMLSEGNARWAAEKAEAPNTGTQRRQSVAQGGQTPFVTVLTCADSRIPVERVFDRGVGDLFVVRVAGNVAGDSELGTIEYGVGHLRTPLLVVMGHTRCGAVAMAATGAAVPGKVAGLVERIRPAVERARRANPEASPQQIADLTVQENVWQTVYDLLKHSPELRRQVAEGKLKIVGAVYDLAGGKVQFTGEHPWQAELLTALGAEAPSPGQTAANSGAATATATAEKQAEPATGDGH
ncbi:MAG: carbonic anhydrase [bacterium]|jgi:carbonic anhydrase|nr:carbonic anhydrase [Phycisphaerales bacterium]MCE2654303.1 carbonic anhydrase [Planctomycetaceae bacterium]